MYYMMLAIAASMMMTACVDEDVERSINLTGSWKGDLNMYYGIEDHRGNYFEFDAEYSDIVFYPDYDFATHGYGKQVDWYLEGPYEKQYYRFYWEILDGVLYLDYPHDPELDTAVYATISPVISRTRIISSVFTRLPTITTGHAITTITCTGRGRAITALVQPMKLRPMRHLNSR